MPYGALELEGDAVRSYTEKPRIPVVVSSGVYVWGPVALAWLAGHAPAGASQLVGALLAAGEPVRAFRHTALWLDLNEAADLGRAEEVIASNPASFPWISP